MIGIGFLVALGPALTILLAATVVWAFVRHRAHIFRRTRNDRPVGRLPSAPTR
jgi:hypothetical protein